MSTPPLTPNRAHELEELFRRSHERLQRTVASRVRADRAVIDCAFAWATLCRRTDIDFADPRTVGWLYTVALHEAYAHTRAAEHVELEPGQYASNPDSLLDIAAEQLEDLQHLQQLAQLKPAEREAILLKAAGYSYSEIQQLTGATYTAVNRRLAEGRAALRGMAQ